LPEPLLYFWQIADLMIFSNPDYFAVLSLRSSCNILRTSIERPEMPNLSKDAELDLLEDALGKITTHTDWLPFLDKVSGVFESKACAAEYLNDGFATGRFTGPAHAEAFRDFLSSASYHAGVSAFKYLLELAEPDAVYRIHQGHISKLDATWQISYKWK
jgi:hypothetical protein